MTAVESELLRRQAYVDGRWVDADSGESFPVANPATGETIAQVPRMGAAETRRAIEAAQRALPDWKNRPAKEQARVLRRLADLMQEHADELAALLVTEQGKPLGEARVESDYAASFYEWFGEEAKRLEGDTVPSPWPDKRIVVTKEAVGVTGRNHAVELPRSNGDSQVGSGTGRRLHDGAETGGADASLGARRRSARGGGRAARRRFLDRHRGRGGRAGCMGRIT
jgi:aldehyde dehydrogenase family protein